MVQVHIVLTLTENCGQTQRTPRRTRSAAVASSRSAEDPESTRDESRVPLQTGAPHLLCAPGRTSGWPPGFRHEAPPPACATRVSPAEDPRSRLPTKGLSPALSSQNHTICIFLCIRTNLLELGGLDASFTWSGPNWELGWELVTLRHSRPWAAMGHSWGSSLSLASRPAPPRSLHRCFFSFVTAQQ